MDKRIKGFKLSKEQERQFISINSKLMNACEEALSRTVEVIEELEGRMSSGRSWIDDYEIRVIISPIVFEDDNEKEMEEIEVFCTGHGNPDKISEVKDRESIYIDKNYNWNIEELKDFQEDYICYCMHDLISHKKWKIEDILKIKEFYIDVKVELQQRYKENRRSENDNVNPKYRYDTFVVSDSNKFAYTAALEVAKFPAASFNPLFIYGADGLGKTHLMHSIEQLVLENNPKTKVLYISSEMFINDVIKSVRNNNMNILRNKYRYIDILLIDNLQFIGGKTATAEVLFNVLNDFCTDGKQIVLASDKPPKEIEGLEEGHTSR